jgi:hypothetical protein
MSGQCGLFSDVFMSLNGIQACRQSGMSGEIHWGKRSLYFDERRGGNAHRYFFSNGRFDFSDKHTCGLISIPYFPSGDNFVSNGNERPRVVLKRLIDRYALPVPDILDEVDEFWRSRFAGSTVLGVHVRRTDALTGFEERRTQSAENFLIESERWLRQRSGGAIFLATDDEGVVGLFKDRFGDKVHVTGAIRSTSGVSIHGHLDGGISGSGHVKGRQALVDALLLSRCDFLIRCFSYLTAYSLCYNPDLQFLDLDRRNLGVVRTRWLHQ